MHSSTSTAECQYSIEMEATYSEHGVMSQQSSTLTSGCLPTMANTSHLVHRIASPHDFEQESDSQDEADPLLLGTRRISNDDLKKVKKQQGKGVYSFYEEQNQIINDLLSPVKAASVDEDSRLIKVKIAVYGSFGANIALFFLQLYAAVNSGSLSLFATMADSFMDLFSSAVLVFAARAATNGNLLKYPVGKARMETVGIIVFSALMGALSLQLIIEGVRTLLGQNHSPALDTWSIVCVSSALVTKFILYLYCGALREFPAAKTFAQDHQNDLLVNGFGLTASLLGTKIAWWIDPVGALIVALVILRSWTSTAYENIQLIVGKSADANFLKKVTYIALTHHPKVLQVDTCRAYHAGNNMLVEVDIVMSPDTPLSESHDIGESLQIKLETLPNVERAFVHVDYETSHQPEHQKFL
ncbi:hypothetical protein K493DRAFT_310109 [Basidiobolus meristosporus CBS 931.73]|uniref:Uncharacterized protein n=1 Tax=Basidiobolus meristosporus CBS 931.73 TaxID=1314790 RepID=A0A1Y1ZD28_9FUNG|nr:hypothetical protein K493DRAFT_310109 [Basidiobolus meristosporus CBS 931.73]|eukprot:ORY07725.1 hypothetical protein K493DRAFT_310109 [Basidiobolus meristosporus CBS 931.73]